MQFNKTKIITTLGPATGTKDMIWKLIKAGADVMRINASHGDHQFLKSIVDNVRSIRSDFFKISTLNFLIDICS